MHEIVPNILENLVSQYGERNVILAGGAVRDYHLDKPIKDYDFFIRGLYDGNKGLFGNKLGGEDVYYEGDITAVYNVPFHSVDIKVQLIFTKEDPRTLVSSFDYNLCKCYYDPTKEDFVFTKEFNEDVKNKTLTLNTENPANFDGKRFERFRGRRVRMAAKFSDYTLKMRTINEDVFGGY